jgi:hypothetical protein
VKRFFRTALFIFLTGLFLLNAVAWVVSEFELVMHVTPNQLVSPEPLRIQWRSWSLLDGRYEYSRHLQEDLPPDPAQPLRTRGIKLSDNTKYYLDIPGFDVSLLTEVAIGIQKKHFEIIVDCWLIALISGAFPGYHLFKSARAFYVRRTGALAGKCQKCRYDLRAHSPGHICPECGAPVPQKTQ